MRLSHLAERLQGGAAAEGFKAWDIHARALAAEARGEDVIVLSVGDSDLDTPGGIRAAAITALDGGDTHYTGIAGRASLRGAVAARFAAQTGLATGVENVMIVSGAQCGLYFACQCVLGPGDAAIAPEPTYVSYAGTVAAAGAQMVRTPSPAEGGFRPDLDAMAAAVTPATRALLIGDPNNPTGVVLSAAERARIAEIARTHDLWVIVDTVYETLCYDRAPGSIASEPGMAERTITVGSVSKSHAMTGWRVGWVIAPAPVIALCEALGHAALYGLPGFAQAGAEAALADPASAAAFRETFRARRDALCDGLAAIPGLRPQVPESGMFALVDIRALETDTGRFAQSLFDTTGVSVLDGAAFGPSAGGHIRVSAALDTARIAEACRRIAGFCARF